MIYNFIKSVNISQLEAELKASSIGSYIQSVTSKGTLITVVTSVDLDEGSKLKLYTLVSSHIPPNASIEYIKTKVIAPARAFADALEIQFIAENIAMGLTQSGKTARMVEIMTKQLPIPGTNISVSIMEAMHAACPSLTVILILLDYYIAHPSLYSDVSPFLTVARFTALRKKVADYLGLR